MLSLFSFKPVIERNALDLNICPKQFPKYVAWYQSFKPEVEPVVFCKADIRFHVEQQAQASNYKWKIRVSDLKICELSFLLFPGEFKFRSQLSTWEKILTLLILKPYLQKQFLFR